VSPPLSLARSQYNPRVGEVRKFAAVLAVVVLLAGGGAACGDEDGSAGSATTSPPASQGSDSDSATTTRDDRDNGGDGEPEGSASPDSSARATSPDSGGGSAQFRSPGGDNSVQSFGEEADDADREEAAEVVRGYLEARAGGDWAKACSYLSAPMLKTLQAFASRSENLKGKGCSAILAAFLGKLPAAARAELTAVDVGSLRVEGDQGFVLYHGAEKTDYFMPLLDEGGAWKIAGLVPVPFP